MNSQTNRLIIKIEKIIQDKKNFEKINKKKKESSISAPDSFFFINNYFSKLNLDLNFNFNYEVEGIKNLINLQRKNGSFDEWYLNENSFCASAYAGYFLSKLKYISTKHDFEINNCLKKLEFFLKKRSNRNNLNQELAKFAFLYYQKRKYDEKMLNQLFKNSSYPDTYEYDGVDLGYLSVNLMIISDLLCHKFNNKLLKIFSNQLHQYSQITNNFKDFANYIFSRSSRLIMISGFIFAYKNKMISKNSFTNIIQNYEKVLNRYILRKDKKYLSFFYSADFSIFTNIVNTRFQNNYKLTDNSKNYSKFYISHKIKKKNILFYLKNANIFAIKDTEIKYFFDRNINYNNYKLVPKKNQKLFLYKNKIILKNTFMKISHINKFKKYLKYISPINKFLKIGDIIKKLGRYLIIHHKKVNDIKSIKLIRIKKNLINVKEIYIIKKKKFVKKFFLSLDNKQFYFSPTSFIEIDDIGKVKNQKIKSFKRLKYNVFVREYDCI